MIKIYKRIPRLADHTEANYKMQRTFLLFRAENDACYRVEREKPLWQCNQLNDIFRDQELINSRESRLINTAAL